MRLLLGSGGLRTAARQAVYFEEMSVLFEDCDEILFIPYAGKNHSQYTKRIADFSEPSGVNIRGIETFQNPLDAIKNAQGLYVGGGNTFLLNSFLHANNLLEIVHKRVFDGMPYMGVSAGANVACPTMQTTNDMPIVQPLSFSAFNLVPFQINAHYHDGNIWMKNGDSFHEHYGETRAQRIREFHEHNTQPVIGLCEGSFLRWTGETGLLLGGDATVFHQGMDPVIYNSGTIFDLQLSNVVAD